jgi:uncharacterized protein (DUF885 family)
MCRSAIVFFVLGLALTTALTLRPVAAAGPSEDARLADLFKAYLDEHFAKHPSEATRLGDHRCDHLLENPTPELRAEAVVRTRRWLEDLPRKIDYAKLSRPGQVDFEIWKTDLTRTLWLAENTKPYEEDPRVYNEYLTGSTYTLLAQSTLPRATNVKNCVARMAFLPAIVATAKKTLTRPPRELVEVAIRQNRGAISFYESDIFRLAEETPQLSELGRAALPVVAALKDYQNFLEKDLLPRATGTWRIGKEKFARKLELELDAGISAEELVAEAEREADRVEREMYVIARQAWAQVFPGRVLPPDDPEGRRAAVRLVLAEFAKQHGKPETLVADARQTVADIKRFIRERDILRLPEPDRCQVIEMPEFKRGFSVAYLENAPPLDNQAASIYAVSPPPADWDTRRVASYLEEYNSHMLKVLTIHEAYPGHYVQLEYSSRHPSLIRKVLFSGVFAEGWAVYTEQMMLDQGFGNGDLALRLHQLKFYLRAVVNAILDYKMHCANLSDEEALELLTKRAFQSEGEAVGKVSRAKQSSCQLSTYFAGRTAFYRLRQAVQRELGDQFDLGRYHEAVLDHGTLPVKYLPELVRDRLKRPR